MYNNSSKTFSIYKKILWGGLVGILILFFVPFFLAVLGVFGKLPTFEAIENPESNLSTEVISSDGKVLGSFWLKENRTPVPYNELPTYLIEALISTEDERFFEHSGIDFKATGRAIIFMGKKGGASTITQQLAKLLFTKKTSDNILERVIQKIKEWIIALKLEHNYTKEEIISMYFNTFDFLYNANGIKSAALTYFNKEPKDLNIEEAAVLVGMAKNPYAYNPKLNPNNALNRRNQVLAQMLRNRCINKKQFEELTKKPIVLDFRVQRHNSGPAQHLREYVREQAPLLIKDKLKPDGTKYNLVKDGLKIYTTIDSRMQQYAEEAVSEHISNMQHVFDVTQKQNKNRPFIGLTDEEIKNILNSAMKRSDRYHSLKRKGLGEKEILQDFNNPIEMQVFVWEDGKASSKKVKASPMDSIRYYKGLLNAGFMAVEPQTGHVKAWVGSISFRHFKYDQVVKSKRQVGSTFKPFVYATAISERKMSPCYEYMDKPVYFKSSEWGIPEDWSPQNSEKNFDNRFYTLTEGLARSKNAITASIIKDLGTTEPVRNLVKNLGITSYISPGPAMCLGVADISLYEMLGAFSTFSNKGVYQKPNFITRIEDSNGIVLYQNQSVTKNVMSEETAYVIVKLLEGVTKFGTGVRLRTGSGYYPMPDNPKKSYITGYPYQFTNPIAGKTGTSQNQSDGWFIGMVPNLTAGAWVGSEDRAAHFESITYGQGASTALPIWALFMKKCYADKTLRLSNGAFEPPAYPLSIDLDCKSIKEVQNINQLKDIADEQF